MNIITWQQYKEIHALEWFQWWIERKFIERHKKEHINDSLSIYLYVYIFICLCVCKWVCVWERVCGRLIACEYDKNNYDEIMK